MLLYIDAPIFLDDTFTSKVHSQALRGRIVASFLLEKDYLDWIADRLAWRVIIAYSMASFICASDGSDPAPPQLANPSARTRGPLFISEAHRCLLAWRGNGLPRRAITVECTSSGGFDATVSANRRVRAREGDGLLFLGYSAAASRQCW
jgi:hypothetical protein